MPDTRYYAALQNHPTSRPAGGCLWGTVAIIGFIVGILLSVVGVRVLPAQAPSCACATSEASDRDRSWLWAAGVLFGGIVLAAGRDRDSGYVDTGLPDRAPTASIPSTYIPRRETGMPWVVLSPRPTRTFVATETEKVCVVEPVPPVRRRSRAAIEQEKAWWGALTPAEKAKIDRENARRARQEAAQRSLLWRCTIGLFGTASRYLAAGAAA
jgi:hypothetical protein